VSERTEYRRLSAPAGNDTSRMPTPAMLRMNPVIVSDSE
jgi:hypothetical protein